MKKLLVYACLYLIAMNGFCENSNTMLAKAKASSLWRLVSKTEVSMESKQLLSQDPVLEKWTLDEMVLYVKSRTQELKEKSLATQRDLAIERPKAVSWIDILKQRLKIIKLHWKDTFSNPTVVDFAVTRRLSQDGKYDEELNELRRAFAAADKVNPVMTNEISAAQTAFESLFPEPTKPK